ncbi:low-specificity L-threonine aldolase [Alphaproteobacteria bacterium]|jgi:threonine aldolase|nr:low-specificity L-threonine aldolase [Alphaproteobacteria bacterium]NCF48052.1 low-specificity L-threonine aldolase [Bacteroidota bacterium]
MNYAGMTRGNAPARVDMRSDTVTRPSQGMIAAMVNADLGDDVYGDDPTVNALQEKAAKLLGKEAALLLSSGTQSNLCAMLAHCQRGEEILTGDQYHVFIDEAGGASVLGSIMFAPMPTGEDGSLNPDDIDKTIKPDDEHCPISRLLTLENTCHGRVIPMAKIKAAAQRGKARGLAVHFDGARLMNACVKLGVAPSEMLADVDSVSLCMSKGLGTPVGTVLAGSKDLIKRAHRIRKLVGGGMRQAGVLAAAGIYALDHNIERLADDHANAIRLGERLGEVKDLAVDLNKIQSNMVFVGLPEGASTPLQKHLLDRGILINGGGQKIRLVTHLDCGIDEIDLFVDEVKAFFA